MASPGVHVRPLCAHNSQSRITGPQPVDNEKKVQLQLEREKHYKLMIEKEQRYVDLLRSQTVTLNNVKKSAELEKAERNLHKLLEMLQTLKDSMTLQELTLARDKTDNPPPLPTTPPPKHLPHLRNGNEGDGHDVPPPLPKRNNRTSIISTNNPAADTQNNHPHAQYANDGRAPSSSLHEEVNGNEGSGFLNQCLTSSPLSNQHQSKAVFAQSRSEHESLAAAASEGRDRCASLGSRKGKNCKKSHSAAGGMLVDNKMYAGGVQQQQQPPPLPPRAPHCCGAGHEPDGANSINKQLSYPLVTTCTTLVNHCVPTHTHQRTKSSPESLLNLSPSEASRQLIASESMNDLSRPDRFDRNATPPGTPPPPYPSPLPGRKSMSNRSSANTDDGDGSFEEITMDSQISPDISPIRASSFSVIGRKYMNSSPIHAATPQVLQQSIISMEDDEISESDLNQIEDHGPFKAISQLWHKENMPYLAVFVNYVLLNCEPSSLLFYLITDLYKEGNAKEMRKWAYEIQSCFLIPGAPLPIGNIDESVVREIDEELAADNIGEEILRKIFWKARTKAKEELTKQLIEFQQKRVAGMGTLYGPKDSSLAEIAADKTPGRDVKLYESLFLEKFNVNDDIETAMQDPKKYYTTAALITVASRVFGVRVPGQLMDRWQTFVNKEKSLKTKFMGRYSRKLSVYGHHYVAQQYYTVINCNNCSQIIYGIGPQGYICSACHINLHRTCISKYNDNCPGPMRGKGMKIKLMDRIRNEKDQKRKQSSQFIQIEKDRRLAEEKDNGIDLDNAGAGTTMWSKQAESRGGKHAGKTASKSHRKRNKNDKKNPDSSSNGAPVGKKNAGTTTKLPPGGTPELGGGRGGGNNNNKTKVKGSDPSLGSIDVCDGGSGPDIIKDIKATLMTSSTEVHAALAKYDDDGTSEVVLRKKPDDGGTASTNNDPLKRYSDSIVNDNCVNNAHENDHRFVLSRTHSGFFLTNAQKESESKEKKRRFSGLFRHSIGKTSSNDDHSKTTEFGINENGRVITLLDVKDKKSEKKSVKRSDSKAQKDKTTAAMEGKKPVEVTTPNSVLKRVRSRIYKTKTENGVSVIPSMPDIREQKEKKSKKTDVKNPPVIPEVKRNTLMDFRMFRQTSNLEYVRPKTMMPSTPKKTLSIDNSMMMFDGEKPTLNKSKSSSAINLSLLRTRRKFLEGKKHQNSTKQVEDEFDFITFDNNYKNSKVALLNRKFGSQDFISNLNNNVTNGIGNNPLRRTSCAPAVTITESKPGNPVTRTPSDRRPDAVREESRNHDTHGQTHDNENDNTSTENSASLPASTTGNKQRHNNNINRSESVKEHSEKNRKQKRNVSDPLHNSDAFMLIEHQQPTTFQQHSGSSSSSSLNSRSFETQLINAQDSDLDVDPDPPNWKSTLTEEQLSGLHAKERARQDVINELFHTERTHVRNLKVLDQVFLRSIVEHKAITETEQNLVFANLPDILSIHTQFNVAMKKKRVEHPVVTEIGDLLLSLFDGELGARFCVAVSKYCEKQQQGLELISEKRKKDSKFDSILSSCEKNNLCRRLPLQGLIPQEMQRTTKYKLLVERLIAIEEELLRLNSEKTAVELDKLNLALEKIKHILNSVNEAAKLAYNECRLEDIRNHMDIVVPGRSDSSTQFNDTLRGIVWKLVQDGAVTIKRQNKTVPAHMLLLKEAVILLHKEGDRFILKSFLNNQAIPPVIKISNLICRPNAADMTCLFLLSNAQNSQMYEIQCADETERKKWFKYLTDASEPYKSRDGKNKRMERNHDPEEDTTQDLVTPKADSVEQVEPICEPELATAGSSGQRNSAALEEEDGVDTTASNSTETEAPVPTIHSAGEGGTVKLTATDWPLIQPSEVQVAETSVHTAEPILTPLEKIKRKDDEIKKALADKEVLVADLLSIPRENYRVIADMVSEKKTDVEPYELVLASVNQVHELISAVKDSLNITEADGVLATGGKHPACNSNEASVKQNHVPSVPASKIQNIAMTLMSQLTILLSSVKQRDEESELMRKEMHRLREQLHEKCNLHPAQSTTNHHDSDETVHHESTQSGDLESIEESPIETETT